MIDLLSNKNIYNEDTIYSTKKKIKISRLFSKLNYDVIYRYNISLYSLDIHIFVLLSL